MGIIFNYLVSTFIFLSGTAYIMGQPFGLTQLNVFKIGVPILWIIGLCLPAKRRVNNLWLNVLVGYALIQTLLLKGQPQIIALEPLIMVFLALILYYTLSDRLQDLKPILNGISAVIGFQAIIVLLQVIGLDPICLNDGRETNMLTKHMIGTFGAKYVLGAWMAIATPILLFNKRKIFGILSAILCVCSFSWASIGLLSLTILFGLSIVNRKRIKWCVGIFAILFSIILFTLINPQTYLADQYVNGEYSKGTLVALHPTSLRYKIKSRIDVESKFLPILFSKPLTGYGLGSFKYIGPQIVNPKTMKYGTMTDAWNDYLERGVELGLPFIPLFLLLCFDVLKRFKRFIVDRSMIGIFCSLLIIPFGMLFHDYMNHASLNVLMISIFSAFSMRAYDEKNLL